MNLISGSIFKLNLLYHSSQSEEWMVMCLDDHIHVTTDIVITEQL